ncbi:hypothetical protein F5877DRAFT_47122 [Lentinula edodes]|nr:hypothetical protein F5877DRAFT_47122 [Lentinula edodes]
MKNRTLPSAHYSRVCVNVSVLIPGHLYLPHKEVFQDALENGAETGSTVPTFSFLLEHPTRGKYLFDLGLRKHAKGYPPALDGILVEFKPNCDKDASEILIENNVDPNEIQANIQTNNYTAYSHLHFDHTGDIQLFPSAEIILGGEAESLFDAPTYPTDPYSPIHGWPDGRSVQYIKFNEKPRTESSSPSSFFNNSNDFFGDGSLFLINAPGHFPGHLAALARDITMNNSETYVLLAGDCCHDRQCYTVVPPSRFIREISEENHEDIAEARTTMASLIQVAKQLPNVVIILAHEKEYEEEGMPLLPVSLNGWAVERVRERRNV